MANPFEIISPEDIEIVKSPEKKEKRRIQTQELLTEINIKMSGLGKFIDKFDGSTIIEPQHLVSINYYITQLIKFCQLEDNKTKDVIKKEIPDWFDELKNDLSDCEEGLVNLHKAVNPKLYGSITEFSQLVHQYEEFKNGRSMTQLRELVKKMDSEK